MVNHHILDVGGVHTGNDPGQPIHRQSVGAWRNRISGRQVDKVRETIRVMDGIFSNFAVRWGVVDPREQDTCDWCGSLHVGEGVQGQYICAAPHETNEEARQCQ